MANLDLQATLNSIKIQLCPPFLFLFLLKLLLTEPVSEQLIFTFFFFFPHVMSIITFANCFLLNTSVLHG